MPSERVQRHIDRLLDEADQVFAQQNWSALQSVARQVLLLDAANEDAQALQRIAEGMLAGQGGASPLPGGEGEGEGAPEYQNNPSTAPATAPHPSVPRTSSPWGRVLCPPVLSPPPS